MARHMTDYKAEAVEALRRLRKAPGMVARLAGALEISRASIYGWRVIPPDRVLQIEHFTAIPRHELRPDLYIPPNRVGKALQRVVSG